MFKNSKFILLVALALLLVLTACNRQASVAPVSSPTETGEAPFPFTTPGDVGMFGTQTAIASTPGAGGQEATPQVIIATETPKPEAAQESGGGQVEAAAEVVNTPVIERPGTYSLQKGEWPICIARRYNLDISSFFAVNGLSMDSKPAAGTTLKIPSTGSWSAGSGARALHAHPTTYTVGSGDTVYTIACYFGDVAPESILAVNGFSNASDIKTGQSIKIP